MFLLVKLDSDKCGKVQLEIGKHLIGRGKFLHCDDKRVSRKHGELEVKDLSLILTALHTNPCFYMKKGTTIRVILNQNNHIELVNGDRFGLLPVDCWYEVLYLPDHFPVPDSRDSIGGVEALDSTEVVNDIGGIEVDKNPGVQQPLNGNASDSAPEPENEIDVSQSLIKDLSFPTASPNSSPSKIPIDLNKENMASPNSNPFKIPNDLNKENMASPNSSPSKIPNDLNKENPTEHQNSHDETDPVDLSVQQNVHVKKEPVDRESLQNPLKRVLPSTSDVKQESTDEVKRVKTEPDDMASTSDGRILHNATPEAQAGPAAAPPRPLRERCMYGANCYRKNPLHKQEYSHPADPDWGPGALGVCPRGAACARRHPRHWATNTHPPGTVPPGQGPVQGNKQRRKKKRQSTESEDSAQDSLGSPDVILTGKRARKKIVVQQWSDPESGDDEDPFQTDDEDDWCPSGSLGTDSQYTQDD